MSEKEQIEYLNWYYRDKWRQELAMTEEEFKKMMTEKDSEEYLEMGFIFDNCIIVP